MFDDNMDGGMPAAPVADDTAVPMADEPAAEEPAADETPAA
jgi:hypothetical protein